MLIQCPKCAGWTDAEPGVCQLCGERFDKNDTSLQKKYDQYSAPGVNPNGAGSAVSPEAKKIIIIMIAVMFFIQLIAILIILML